MRLTALWVCGTLLAFSSLSWITADSDEGLLLGNKGFGPCIATLRPDGPCRHDESSCPYLFSLPPLTVHLPQQLRELEKIMEDVQKLKDSVDQLRELCADCTVSQTERECGRQREHEKLSEGKDGCEDKRNWMNERLQENDRDFREEFGTDRVRVDKTEGDGDSENRLFLEEKERGKWETERESDRGVIKGNEKEGTRTEVAEKGGKTQTEGTKGKDKLGQTKVPTAGGNERKVAIMREKVADKNTRTDKKKENAGTQNHKPLQEDKESAKERKVQPHVWQGETKETEKTQTEASDKIKMSEDHGGHTNKEQEQHEEERKKEMEKGIKVEENIKKPKQTENIRRTEKEKTIKEGEAEEEGRKTGKEIKTEEEKTGNVQRNSDGELSSNKAIERTDFVSISPTPQSIINIASRPDSNKATIFTSSIPSLSLPSSTLDLITDARHEAITAYGPTQSTGLRAAAFSEPPHPEAASDTTTATISTLGGPGQQKTSATTKLNSASKVRPGADFQGHISSTTTPHQNLNIMTFPGATDQSQWTAKKNISSNTKTGMKPLPGQGPRLGETYKLGIKPEDQKPKNPKNVRKSDQAPSPDKKTKHDQKQKPSLYKPKPASNPEGGNVSKPNQRAPPDILPTDQNLKRHPTPKHNQDRTPDQNKSPLQKPKPHQKPVTPARTPTTHQRPETVNTTHSDKHPRINQKQKLPLYNPIINQSKPANNPEQDQISESDRQTTPNSLPTDQNLKNKSAPKGDQGLRPDQNKSQLQKPKPHQKPVTPVRTPTTHRRPETVNATSSDKDPLINQKQKPSLYIPATDQSKPVNDPRRVQTSKPDQRPRPDILPTDQSLKNTPTSKQDQDHTPGQNKLSIQKPKSDQTNLGPVLKPTSDQRPKVVNVTNSDKDPQINQKQKPTRYKPTTNQSKPAHNPERDQTSKHDQRTPSDLLPTDQNLKNNPTPKSDEDRRPDQNQLPHQKPKFHQTSAGPVQKPTSNQRPETLSTTHSDKHPIIYQKQKPSLYNPTTDQSNPANDPERDQISKHDQRTPSDLLPTDQNMKNNPTPTGDEDRRPDQNQLPHQKPKSHQTPAGPVQRPTSHQRPETVNTTHSDKHLIINQKQKPSLYNPTTNQSNPANDPERDQISISDQRTPPDILPTDQSLKNSPTSRQDQDRRPDQNKSPLQTPESHHKPVTPVRTPTTHRRPETVDASNSDKNPFINQKQKPSLYNPTTDQSKPTYNPDHISDPDQRTPPDSLPTDQNLKKNPIPKHNQDQTPDQLNRLPTETPNSKSGVPVQRPTSHLNVNATYSDKYPIIERAHESNGTPAINPNSKPEEKLVHPIKTDQVGEKQNPGIKSHREEKMQPDQNVGLNQHPKPVQEPESKRSETESFTPKPNQTLLIESREKSDANPSFEPKSNQGSTPGQKITPDRDNTPPDQKPKPSQKIPKNNQKPKPGQAPKPNQKPPRPVTEIKTKPNVNRKTDVPQTNQSLNTPRPGQIPNLNAKSVPGAGPEAKSVKTPKLKPPPQYRPPAKPAVKPGVTPTKRPRPAVQPKPNTKTKTHLIPTKISWTISDAVKNSQTDMPPTAGPAKQITEVTHSPGDTEFSPSMKKTITLAPKTSNSLETGASPHLHTLPEDFTTSPNSRSMSDPRPQTASQPPSIPMTTRPNKITRRILPSVIPNTRPDPMKPNLTPKSDSSLQDETLHNVDSTAPARPVPSPSSQTTSALGPDSRSTTPATSGPEPLAAESSTPSARELRVKINQVAAFLNNSLNPNGRPPHRHPNEQPEDIQGSSRPDRTAGKLPTLTPSKVLYRDCSDHLLGGEARSGVYLVTPDPRGRSFPVFCDMEQGGGGWTVLQRRQDGSVSFNRTWAEYQSGFGELDGGEFWLGNSLIHLLTRDRDMALRVELEDFDGVAEFARYEQFRVASERLRYRLTVGGYSGTAGDALRFNKNYDHNHRAFTTPDRDHDRYPSGNCGVYYSSGWWFDACMAANLNGRYYMGRYKGVRDGIFWGTWHNISMEYYPTNDRQSFKSVRMMIRPKDFAP